MNARRALGLISLVVRDYDEALAFYVDVLGFELVEDTEIPAQSKRWVVVSPGAAGARILLAKAATRDQLAHVGNQTSGRVFLFLYTDDCLRDHARLSAKGVRFVREPEIQDHGLVAVFADLYGNLWDLIEPNAANRSWRW